MRTDLAGILVSRRDCQPLTLCSGHPLLTSVVSSIKATTSFPTRITPSSDSACPTFPAPLCSHHITSRPAEPNPSGAGRREGELCHGAGGGQVGGAAGPASGGPGVADAHRPAPPVLARPLPDADGAHRVAPRLQARPGPGARAPRRRHPAGPRARARRLLPARRPPRRVVVRLRGGAPPRRLLRPGRLVRRGRRPVPPRGRRLPRVPAPDPQGRPPPAPAATAGAPGGSQAHPPRPGDVVRVRRLRGGLPLQPRGGGRPGRGAVHERRRGAGARGGQRLGPARLGPRRGPGPGGRGRRRPPGPGWRQAARVPRRRHLRRLHRPLQVPVRGGDRRRAVLGVRGAHRQGVAVADPRRGVRPGHPCPPLLRHERAPAPPRPPRRRVLRQLLLHHARLLHRGKGGGGLRHRRRQDHPRGQEAAAVGVRAVGGGGGGRRGPVPDHLRLPDAARVGLDTPGLRRGGLRLGPARPRRAADQPRLHRHVHPRQAVGPQARGTAHHAVRHARPRHRLPRRHGGHELNHFDRPR